MNHDEKNRLFESWYQAYIKSHDVGNPAKYKEFARGAFWAGYEAAQPSLPVRKARTQTGVHPTGGGRACLDCGFPNGEHVTHTCVPKPATSG